MSTTVAPADDRYQPGVCNIGPQEIARRRRFGHVAAFATAGMLGALLTTDAPRVLRLLVALPAMGAASGYLQAREKFCAGYGRLGVFNFGELGSSTAVVDEQAREADRRTSQEISVQSLLIGLGVAAVVMLLPD